ncbi:MAG: ABC transporter [Planctomycetota bacterium]|nr:MAG: ABC transporter [Planctomycetota bacterium]
MAILNDDINQLERFLDGGANDLLQLFTSVLLIGALFFYLAPEVAWMAMLPMPAVLWGSLRYQRWLAPRYAEVRERAGQLGAQLASNLEGIATIKAFCAEQREWERIRRTSEAYRDSNRRAIRLSAAFTPLIRMVIVLGFTAMLVFGGLQVLEGSLAVGAYSVLVFMTQRLLWPLTRLGGMLDLYQRAMASTTRVLDLLDTPVAIRDGRTRLARGRVRGEVRFEGVRFAYPGRPPLFEDLTLQIAPGEMVGIVGASGAGKTTLIKLLLRLYEPQAGRVLLDGRDVRELRLEDLRAAIGLVAQEVFLFDGTIHENIAYGTGGDPAPHEIERAAQLAEADGFIRELPLGYRTRIGERGVRLSVGQRQRLAIARALLKEPPVLVFDEATSAVDNETEAAIQRSLARVAAGRTTIVIAHRLSTVRHADRIVVLERGQVREQGTHAELLAAGGLYAALWRVQTGEAESALAAPR